MDALRIESGRLIEETSWEVDTLKDWERNENCGVSILKAGRRLFVSVWFRSWDQGSDVRDYQCLNLAKNKSEAESMFSHLVSVHRKIA